MEPHRSSLEAASWVALVAALCLRLYFSGGALTQLGLTPASGAGTLAFLVVDWTWVFLALAAAYWTWLRLAGRWAHLGAVSVALVSAAGWALGALTRYWNGQAQAWDLANYVQPMWRTAHGLDMGSAVFDGREVWADHGAFVMFLLAPLTRLFDDAATGLLLAQSAFLAGAVLGFYALARALALPAWLGLTATVVMAGSRALAQAARFDFHAESLLPLGLIGIAWAHERGRTGWAIAATLLCSGLRDMAALSAAALWCYFALAELCSRAEPRASTRRRVLPWALAGAALAVGLFDMFVLPAWSGWYSYLALNTSTASDFSTSLQATLLRALSTFGLGWLHPLAWIAGAPWAVAAFVSPKLAVKGIDFQYGFFFVPVAGLGALYALRWIQARRPRWLAPLSLGWAACALAVNAPPAVSLEQALGARGAFLALHARLAALLGAEGVAADACSAPYAMERAELTLLCRIDVAELQRGRERWDEPVEGALTMPQILVRPDCGANGACVAAQVGRAQRAHGFLRVGRVGPFLVLRRAP